MKVCGHFWQAERVPKGRGRAGPVRASTFVPSFPELDRSFWRQYGFQTAGALVAFAFGVLGCIFYAPSLLMFGTTALMSLVVFATAIIAGITLPIHYYRRHRLILSFDVPTKESASAAKMD